MATQKMSTASYTAGTVLLFVPVVLGALLAFDVLPQTTPVRVAVVVGIIGCVGAGSYLAWWGRQPSKRRGEWRPSQTLPRDGQE